MVEQRLETALGLLEHCDRLYIGSGETERRALNQAFFDSLYLDENGVVEAVLNTPFAELVDRSITLAGGKDEDEPPPEGPDSQDGQDLTEALRRATTRPRDRLDPCPFKDKPPDSRVRGFERLNFGGGGGI